MTSSSGKANVFFLKPYGCSHFKCAVLTTSPEGEFPIREETRCRSRRQFDTTSRAWQSSALLIRIASFAAGARDDSHSWCQTMVPVPVAVEADHQNPRC